MPCTLRKVSCWPAKDASGRSSAVAEERTAKLASRLPADSCSNAARISRSSSGGKGCASSQPRISAPATASARTSSVSSFASRSRMRWSRPPCLRNSRKAWAVVAKPVGTRTPCGSCEIISPRLAFLPPTTSTSDILRFSNGTTRAVALKRADAGRLRKLKRVCAQAHGARARRWALVLLEGAAAGHRHWNSDNGRDCGRPCTRALSSSSPTAPASRPRLSATPSWPSSN